MRSWKLPAVAAIGTTALLITACEPTLISQSVSLPPVADRDVAKINFSDGSLEPGQRISIKPTKGWTVEEASAVGQDVEMHTSAKTGAWRTNQLPPHASVDVHAVLVNPTTGQSHEINRTVTTGAPTQTYSATLYPEGGTYGVGIIPTVTFDREIPEKNRADVASRLKVTTSKPVDGGWRWISATTAAYRPISGYWPGKTDVTIDADIQGLPVGTGRDTSFGQSDKSTSFSLDRSFVMKIDSATKQARILINGKVARTVPISLGKPGFTTRSGIKTITEKYRVLRMTSEGFSTATPYDVQSPFSMRITNSGEFLHAAPWNGNIGYANTSHGCTNLRYYDAEWIFNRAIIGDVVETRGTGRPMETWNGPGALWNIPGSEWVRTKIT